ncbi:hypothetical protein GCM10009624_10100 [Gordonia sinesedis]
MEAQPRRPGWRVIVLAPVVAAMLGAIGACSLGGSAEAVPDDLSSRSVAADDFPVPGATRIPPPVVADALADLVGSGTQVAPPDCAPQHLPADGAVMFQVLVDDATPTPPSTPTQPPSNSPSTPAPATARAASFTSAVAHAPQALDAELDRVRRCPTVTTGAPPATSRLRSEIGTAPAGPRGVTTGAVRTVAETGPSAEPLAVVTETLMAQRDGVRVYAQYRTPGTEIGDAARAQLTQLFGKAVDAAFG